MLGKGNRPKADAASKSDEKERWRASIVGRDTARVDIPLVTRRSLRDAGQLLHRLGNTLTRLSLNGSDEILRDSTALLMAQNAIFGIQKAMTEIKLADIAEAKRQGINFGTEHVVDSNGKSIA